MTTNLIAALAAAGLITAGVASASETRSASAVPTVALVQAKAHAARNKVSSSKLADNDDDDAAERGGGGGSGGGTVLGILAAALAAGGLAVGLGNKSNG